MAGLYGYKDEASFQAAIDRELELRTMHDREGSWGRTEDAKAEVKLRGKPNSPERLKQVARAAGVDYQTLVNTVSRGQQGQALLREVKTLTEGYDHDALHRAAELTIALQDENVARAAMNALSPEVAQAYFQRMVEVAEGRDQTSEEERIAARQKLLESEYARAERLGPGVVEQVDALAHTHAETIYEDLADDEVQVLLRAQAEQARAERSALHQFGIKNAIVTEVLRGEGHPGSDWTDAERGRWEAEMREAALGGYTENVVSPDQAISKAAATLQPKRTMTDAIMGELEQMAGHDRENLEAERYGETVES